uniref:Uncharacterized protein n=1 Tax=Sphaerodactylus townsendi TaxID=933632 RepID=A0ACB8FJR4_9SAUR
MDGAMGREDSNNGSNKDSKAQDIDDKTAEGVLQGLGEGPSGATDGSMSDPCQPPRGAPMVVQQAVSAPQPVVPVAMAGGHALQGPQAPGGQAGWQWKRKMLKAERDPEKLSYFPIHVRSYMRIMRVGCETDVGQVHEVGALLEAKGFWPGGLFEDNALELQDFDYFILSLWLRFEKPFLEDKTRAQLQHLCQGSKSVAEYVDKFCQLTSSESP